MSRRLVIRTGVRVRIIDGAGLDAGKTGTVIRRIDIPVDGRGIPKLQGYYKPMEKRDVPIRLDDGRLTVMDSFLIRPVGDA
jgi:hypothetical protein